MSKQKVYEVARDLGVDHKQMVALFHTVGITDVKNHMSAVSAEQVDRVRRHLERQTAVPVVEEQIRSGVIKRRRPGEPAAPSQRSSPVAAPPPAARPAAPPPPPAPPPAPPPPPVAVEPPPAEPRAPEPPPVATGAAPPVKSSPRAAPIPERPAPEPPSAPRAVEPPPAPVAPAPAPAAVAPPAPEPPAELPVEPPPAPAPAPPAAPAAAAPARPAPALPPPRPSTPPKTGIDVWEGRPGVPMPPPASRAPAPRRVQYDAKAPTSAAPRRGGPGAFMGARGGMQQRGKKQVGLSSLSQRKTGQVVTQERSAHKKVIKIEESVGLQTLAAKMGVKATEVLMKLVRLGMTGVNINSNLDAETAKIVTSDFGWEIEDVSVSEEAALEAAQGISSTEEDGEREPRPPVVTVMGHVDHGKTSLLDKLRRANVAAGEAGGITQHIGAYSVDTSRGRVTFLDTPGHEAFTAMRARGAQTTDVVVLVVAADDGAMPQTREAVSHAKAAKVPVVVAVNKCDKPEAQPDRVRRELSELGLVPEEWGGDTLYADVSAMTGKGLDDLLEKIALQAEMLDLRASPGKPATGVVVEAELDRGKGPVATVLVLDGTLQRGDVLLVGDAYGKVRAMLDDKGRNVAAAPPAMPVSIIGLSDVPSAGEPVHVVKDLKIAQEIAEGRKSKERRSLMPSKGPRMSIDDIATLMATSEQLEVKLIIKADVQGSVEAVAEALTRLSTPKVKVSVVHSGVGAITEGDVNLAVAAGAIIIGFNARPAGKAGALAQKEKVEIRQYGVIYTVVDEVRAAMEGKLAPTYVEKQIGTAEVRQVFKLSKAGVIAGSMVTSGSVKRGATGRLVREGEQVWEGKISGLKRFKEDVREVKEGFECGISLEGYDDVQVGDVITVIELEQVKQTL
ncbi:MAG: translation initiation factor IF-2 [Polyangiaceae bacterium]|nr:translation initiation factor IF-2 [Polyangiaceae bacterium]